MHNEVFLTLYMLRWNTETQLPKMHLRLKSQKIILAGGDSWKLYDSAQAPKAGLPPKSGCQVPGIFDHGDSTTFKPALVFDYLLSKQNLFCYNLSGATCPSAAI